MLTPIFESHAHYDDEAFEKDRETLLSTMNENRIGTIINAGASIPSTQKGVDLAHQYPFLYAAVGIHPSETKELTDRDMEWLKQLAADPKVAAIGEIGLDYHWNEPAPNIQQHWFCRQLALARETKLPVIIHSREAAKDTLELMHTEHAETLTGVIHCYSYSKETARDYLNMGYYFGIGGVITFSNAKKLKEVVQYIPLEQILLETDSPYLAPVPYRGQRNCSLYLPIIAQAIADLKKIDVEEVITVTTRNAQQLFTKCKADMCRNGGTLG